MKRVMITLLALAFLISSAQIAAHNPALAQEGWQALANAVAFTQQQQANAIRTSGWRRRFRPLRRASASISTIHRRSSTSGGAQRAAPPSSPRC